MKLQLRVTAPSAQPCNFEHAGPEICLGRDPTCQLVLDGDAYQQVSWRHARFELTTRGAYLSDLESTNGTYVNDRPVNGRATVRRGDEVRLGRTGPRLELVELDLTPAPLPRPAAAPRRAKASAPPPPPPAAAAPARDVVRAPALREAVWWKALARDVCRERFLLEGAAVLGVLVLLVVGWVVLENSWRSVPTGHIETVPDSPSGEAIEAPRVAVPPAVEPAPKKAPVVPPLAARPAEDLAGQAKSVLTRHCYRCHGKDGSKKGGVNYILEPDKLIDEKKVVRGNPEESALFKLVRAGEMPPESVKQRPTEAEIQLLARWIKAGAPAAGAAGQAVARRPFVDDLEVLKALRDDLRKAPLEQRRFLRYYSLTHLHNNNQTVSDADLKVYRAAFAKLINSLSWKEKIVTPTAVDPQQTVYRIHLGELDWDHARWAALVASYPYGLKYEFDDRLELQQTAKEVYRDADTKLPMVRIDWLVATASRPPLYHTLLDLPDKAGTLEENLGVNVAANFRNPQVDRIARAGFNQSGVSGNNRLVERHNAKYGAYWKSYDFRSSAGRGNLARFPLGPANLPGHPFPNEAFEHDGGEIIFNLPNGLQGYLLVNGKDERIDIGPTDVVADDKRVSGTQEIVNGLSCMACHKRGMITDNITKDIIRGGNRAVDAAGDKVRALYPGPAVMQGLLAGDIQRFSRAVEAATRGLVEDPFTREPIAAVAEPYRNRELDLTTVAAELGLPSTDGLAERVANSLTLRTLGLGPLALEDGVIKREAWEKALAAGDFTVFQLTAKELRRGEPAKNSNGQPGDLPP